MEFKGTKGEWVLSKVPMQESIPLGRVSYLIATESKDIVNVYDEGDEETESNFKLIAAAPDLLKVCVTAMAMCNSLLMPT